MNAIPASPIGRLAFMAEAMGVPVPPELPADLLDDDGGPAADLLTFCAETGASLDFIFHGDIRPMIRAAYHKTREAVTKPPRMDAVGRAYQVNALIRCAMLAEENETSGVDVRGTATVMAVAEELMGEVLDALELAQRESWGAVKP